MTTLVRKRTVYELDAIGVDTEHPENERVYFVVDDDEPGAADSIIMYAIDYDEMGRPHQITVSIEPGNRLR